MIAVLLLCLPALFLFWLLTDDDAPEDNINDLDP